MTEEEMVKWHHQLNGHGFGLEGEKRTPLSCRVATGISWSPLSAVKGFGIVKKAEIDVFLELSCFFHDPADVGNLISGSSSFSKASLNIRKFTVHVLLKPGLENFLLEPSPLAADCCLKQQVSLSQSGGWKAGIRVPVWLGSGCQYGWALGADPLPGLLKCPSHSEYSMNGCCC